MPFDNAKNKALRLFTYIEKVLSTEEYIERNFRDSSTSYWWLSEMPIAENLDFKKLDTPLVETDQQGGESIDKYFFKVEKRTIKKAPAVPAQIVDWININYGDAFHIPTCKETITQSVSFEDDSARVEEFKKISSATFYPGMSIPESLNGWITRGKTGKLKKVPVRYIELKFTDDTGRVNLFNDYVEHGWKKWQAVVLPIIQANKIYEELYALILKFKNEGDSQELLWGHGLLTWEHSAQVSINSQIFLTPLRIEFDPAKRIIELVPDPMRSSFCEINAICELGHPLELDLIKWADTFNAEPFDLWNIEALKTQSKYLTGQLSPNGCDAFSVNPISNPEISTDPSFWNAPVIFTRKRSVDLWSKYAKKIREDIESNDNPVTSFINDLVGEISQTVSGNDVSVSRDVELPEGELFFPLLWNDEQKRIAEQLEYNYGAVVKGPPGTGKSHTIANLIARCLAQGKTVLVTSQTSKALDVLREKLPKEIRSLAVSQLEQSARHDQILQESITEIGANLCERNTKFSEQQISKLRNDLVEIRTQKAGLINDIQHWAFVDSNNQLSINGQEISPIAAAHELAQSEAKYEWFKDCVNCNQELVISDNDINEYVSILKTLPRHDRELYKYSLPDKSAVPNVDIVVNAFNSFEALCERSRLWEIVRTQNLSLPPHFTQALVNDLVEQIQEAKKHLNSFNKEWEREIFAKCLSSHSEYMQWQNAWQQMHERVENIRLYNKQLLGNSILSTIDYSDEEILTSIDVLKKKCGKDGRIGRLSQIVLPAACKKIVLNCKVNGLPPSNLLKFKLLESHILAGKASKEVGLIWEQVFSTLTTPLMYPGISNGNVLLIETMLEILSRILDYKIKFEHIGKAMMEFKTLSHFKYYEIEDLDKFLEILTSYLTTYELSGLNNLFAEWESCIMKSTSHPRHAIVEKMLSTMKAKDVVVWREQFDEYLNLLRLKDKSQKFNELNAKLTSIVPKLVDTISSKIDLSGDYAFEGALSDAWRIARLRSWLNELHGKVSIDILQNQLERLIKQENRVNAALISVMAWQRQIDRVGKKQKDALMAWSLEMKKYGKGTGKYANIHLNAAQKALKDAKDAVPVWIMPLHRVAQMFPDPKAGMFDLVIFDEASQCDIRGITIAYLGKQILVVGDPEQISPAGVFQDQEKVFELIPRYLYDIPHGESFSITSSLFDIAALRLPNIIMLVEHFRSVPDIIAFSNHHCYENKIKTLRYPNPKDMLTPALNPIFVKEGYQNTNNKVNEPEAQALVNKIFECLIDPAYQKHSDGRPYTFGVISLLAEDQAKYIDQLLNERLNERDRELRKIVCGDAYAFQGDERDVIFLSMVKAIDQNAPDSKVPAQTRQITKQSFNVAASRARDQVFLFHSLALESLSTNPDDWRYKLLNWYYHPQTENVKIGKEALLNEFRSGKASQFSVDVGNLIIEKGFKVIPEFEAVGRRIDLVVQGENARLAVECDGDRWHGLEQWEKDQIRERQLRRAGWEFWRVTGSSFYRHKEKALESLWEKLREMNITPME